MILGAMKVLSGGIGPKFRIENTLTSKMLWRIYRMGGLHEINQNIAGA